MSGRPVVIEVNLAKNAESRRAVVAQILAYAAYLHGTTRAQLEDRLRGGLQCKGHATILEAVSASDQEGAFDSEEFTASLDDHLREGRFRLVFVLDAAPPELMTLVAYLEHVTDKLVIDLVAVSAFDVNGTAVMIPQRVTPERHEVVVEQTRRTESATLHQGSEVFEASIGEASEEHQSNLRRLLEWARGLEQKGLVRLITMRGKDGRFTLRLHLPAKDAGLVTIWNDKGAYVSFTRTVFERNQATDFIEPVEALIGSRLGQGNWTQDVSDELLDVLTRAHEQAAK